MADKAHGLELRAAGITRPNEKGQVAGCKSQLVSIGILDTADEAIAQDRAAPPYGASAAPTADRGASISGATDSPSPVIDPVPRCAGPPAYPQAFLEWLKTSESPARKALRGLVP